MYKIICSTVILSLLLAPWSLHAKTFRWASQGDILTLDPHAQNEGMTNTAASYIYETLVTYDKDFKLVPSLAESWQFIDPNRLRLQLRQHVRFHDNALFSADDVVFSITRAMAPSSNFKSSTNGIVAIEKIDATHVDILTDKPNPVLLRQLTNLFIMNEAWAKAHNATEPQDFAAKQLSYSALHTNGTGPYKLLSREVDVRTVFTAHEAWWNQANKVGNVSRVEYSPIKQNSTRTAALLSGEIDFVLDPPTQDLARLQEQLKVLQGNESRTIYLGFDQSSPELKYSNIQGKNPFSDKRVRQALYLAIDTHALQSTVMRGYSLPTGTMIAPQVHGWSAELAQRVPPHTEQAQTLLREAGYAPNELNFTLDCPNNRYINDEAICQAVVGMWARIGVKATLNALPRATYFPKVQSRDTSAYLFGWGVPTYDALYTLQNLLHSPGVGADGAFNFGNYHNPEVDALIQQIKYETDVPARDAAIHKALALHAADFGHIPLHDQVIPWAMRKNIDVVHRANNRLTADWVIVH